MRKHQEYMISIIICSRQKEINTALKNNINSTIGCQYEIIWIDNSMNQYSIFEAYDKGIQKASGELLCFMHEDIIFHSDKWGVICQKEFVQNSEIGMIGVIGGYYLSRFSTDWASTGLETSCGRVIGRGGAQGGGNLLNNNELSSFVVTIDGLWMCIRKNLFDNIKWDIETYKGFHFYDMDISMQINKIGKKIKISHDITIEHLSTGNCNRNFYENCIKFHEKWNQFLPIQSIPDLPIEYIEKSELIFMKNYCTYTTLYKEQTDILNQPLHKLVTKITLIIKKLMKRVKLYNSSKSKTRI